MQPSHLYMLILPSSTFHCQIDQYMQVSELPWNEALQMNTEEMSTHFECVTQKQAWCSFLHEQSSINPKTLYPQSA